MGVVLRGERWGWLEAHRIRTLPIMRFAIPRSPLVSVNAFNQLLNAAGGGEETQARAGAEARRHFVFGPGPGTDAGFLKLLT